MDQFWLPADRSRALEQILILHEEFAVKKIPNPCRNTVEVRAEIVGLLVACGSGFTLSTVTVLLLKLAVHLAPHNLCHEACNDLTPHNLATWRSVREHWLGRTRM